MAFSGGNDPASTEYGMASVLALQATGNIVAVMEAMRHERVDTLRIYSHPELTQIQDAMNKRNEAVQ